LWDIQEGKCYFCGNSIGASVADRSYELDHLVALSNRGTKWPINLALVCKKCNQSKYTKSEEEFWYSLKKLNGIEWYRHRMNVIIIIHKGKSKAFPGQKQNCQLDEVVGYIYR